MGTLDPVMEKSRDTSNLPSTASWSPSVSSEHHESSERDPEEVLPSQLEQEISQSAARRMTSTGTTGTNDPSFEIDWDGEDDPRNPQNWSSWYKALMVGTLSWSTWV